MQTRLSANQSGARTILAIAFDEGECSLFFKAGLPIS